MDDLVQLGAYVLIILVIGGASVIKKIIEAQRRRKEMEQAQGKTLRVEPTYSREAEDQTISQVEEVEREVIIESESESSEEKPKIDDILKELFNIPTVPQKRTTIIKNIPHNQEDISQSVKRPSLTAEMVDEDALTHSETATLSTEPNWEVFATGLKSRELTGIQRAIVMSELIQKPKSRKRI